MGLLSNVPLVLVLCYDKARNQDKTTGRNVQTNHWDWGLGQPRHEFLNVSNPESLSERRPKSGVIPEMEVKTVREVELNVWRGIHLWSLRVIESFPLFNGEELAELGIPESNSLGGFPVGEPVVNLRGACLPHTRTSSAWHRRRLGPV